MLSRKYRLSQEKDILEVLRNGRVFYSDYFVLRILKKRVAVSRFGFVVSKKIHNKPTKRNQPKKRMRHIISDHMREILLKGDYLFVAKKRILDLSYRQLEEEIVGVLKKAKVF